jgi:hypothetical protein
MDPKPSESEIVHAAIEALLVVVARSADDLRMFHDALAKARMARQAPFPRVAVSTTESIIEHLKKVDEQLREVMVALGLPGSSGPVPG